MTRILFALGLSALAVTGPVVAGGWGVDLPSLTYPSSGDATPVAPVTPVRSGRDDKG